MANLKALEFKSRKSSPYKIKVFKIPCIRWMCPYFGNLVSSAFKWGDGRGRGWLVNVLLYLACQTIQ